MKLRLRWVWITRTADAIIARISPRSLEEVVKDAENKADRIEAQLELTKRLDKAIERIKNVSRESHSLRKRNYVKWFAIGFGILIVLIILGSC